jgi:DEAD/DEAH box helicase domain-containing protein
VIEQLGGKIERPFYDLCSFAAKALNRRVKAAEVLDATLGLQKTAHGLDAPRFYAQGDTRSLWEYCLNDVLLEFLLFRFARDNGYLLVEDRGRLIACPCPDPSEVAYGF